MWQLTLNERTKSYEEKVAIYLLTYGFNIKRNNKRKERSIRNINPIKLIKRV